MAIIRLVDQERRRAGFEHFAIHDRALFVVDHAGLAGQHHPVAVLEIADGVGEGRRARSRPSPDTSRRRHGRSRPSVQHRLRRALLSARPGRRRTGYFSALAFSDKGSERMLREHKAGRYARSSQTTAFLFQAGHQTDLSGVSLVTLGTTGGKEGCGVGQPTTHPPDWAGFRKFGRESHLIGWIAHLFRGVRRANV